MLILLSPSKSVMKQSQPDDLTMSSPLFSDKTDLLVAKLQTLNQKKLKKTLQISDVLAELNYERFQSWNVAKKRAALWMYGGDLYNGINAYSLQKDDIPYAQKHILILSGLYGLLRPLDEVQPYRLEMKLPFSPKKNQTLYGFWGNDLAQYVDGQILLMCASPEYTKAITPHLSEDAQIITPRFMQKTKDGIKEKGLFAKYGRGSLARWCIDNKINDPNDVKKYNQDGFAYSHDLSSNNSPIYIIPSDFSLKGRFTNK